MPHVLCQSLLIQMPHIIYQSLLVMFHILCQSLLSLQIVNQYTRRPTTLWLTTRPMRLSTITESHWDTVQGHLLGLINDILVKLKPLIVVHFRATPLAMDLLIMSMDLLVSMHHHLVNTMGTCTHLQHTLICMELHITTRIMKAISSKMHQALGASLAMLSPHHHVSYLLVIC